MLPPWLQIHSTNQLKYLSDEIKRQTNVVGIFPNDATIKPFSTEPGNQRAPALPTAHKLHHSAGRDPCS